VILGLSIFALSLGVMGTVFIDRYRVLARLFAGSAGG
jgi:flagellar biosynthetic protein FliR